MTPEDRRLCALAAALAPRLAPGWLRRAPAPEAADETARLSALPRAARLAALAGASAPPRAVPPGAPERPAVAAVLAAVVAGRPPVAPVSPILLRLCRERAAGAERDGRAI